MNKLLVQFTVLLTICVSSCQQLSQPNYASARRIMDFNRNLAIGYVKQSEWTTHYSTIINWLTGEDLYSKSKTVKITKLNQEEYPLELSVEVWYEEIFYEPDEDISYRFDMVYNRINGQWKISNTSLTSN